jgi:hypothetical protein
MSELCSPAKGLARAKARLFSSILLMVRTGEIPGYRFDDPSDLRTEAGSLLG